MHTNPRGWRARAAAVGTGVAVAAVAVGALAVLGPAGIGQALGAPLGLTADLEGTSTGDLLYQPVEAPELLAAETAVPPSVKADEKDAVTLLNHWSYTGENPHGKSKKPKKH